MDLEYGTCEICGREAKLQQKYYVFDIKCKCHSWDHIEIIKYCSDCIPIPPPYTKIVLFDKKDEHNKEIVIDTEILELILDAR
jgi:hypothetical protein